MILAPIHCRAGDVCPIQFLTDRDPQKTNPMTNRTILGAIALAAAAAAGCTSFERQSSLTSPSAAGNNSFLGSWTSSTLIPTPSTCTDFKWDVTEQTGTTLKGSFSATCPGDLKFTGTAQGGLTTAASISWSAQGNATAPGL